MLKSRTPLQRKAKYSVMDLDAGARPNAASSPVLQGARKRWSALSTKLGLTGGGGGDGGGGGGDGAAGGAASRARAHDPEEIDAFLAEEHAAHDAETQRVLRKAQLDWELQAETTRAAVEKERNELLAAMDHERNEWREQRARERNEWKEQTAQLKLANSARIRELRLLAESKLEQAGSDVEDLEMRSESLERELALSAELHDHQYREVAIYHRTLVRLRAGFHFRSWRHVVVEKRARVRKRVEASMARWLFNHRERPFRRIVAFGERRVAVALRWRALRDKRLERFVTARIAQLRTVRLHSQRVIKRLQNLAMLGLWGRWSRHVEARLWARAVAKRTRAMIVDAHVGQCFWWWAENARHLAHMRDLTNRIAMRMHGASVKMVFSEWHRLVLHTSSGRLRIAKVYFGGWREGAAQRAWERGMVAKWIRGCKRATAASRRMELEFAMRQLRAHAQAHGEEEERRAAAAAEARAAAKKFAAKFFARMHNKRVAAAFRTWEKKSAAAAVAAAAAKRRAREEEKDAAAAGAAAAAPPVAPPQPAPPQPAQQHPPPAHYAPHPHYAPQMYAAAPYGAAPYGAHQPYAAAAPLPVAPQRAMPFPGFRGAFADEELLRNARSAERARTSRYAGEGYNQLMRDSYEQTVQELHALGCGATLRNLSIAYAGTALGEQATLRGTFAATAGGSAGFRSAAPSPP
jgi:hypothetical protein